MSANTCAASLRPSDNSQSHGQDHDIEVDGSYASSPSSSALQAPLSPKPDSYRASNSLSSSSSMPWTQQEDILLQKVRYLRPSRTWNELAQLLREVDERWTKSAVECEARWESTELFRQLNEFGGCSSASMIPTCSGNEEGGLRGPGAQSANSTALIARLIQADPRISTDVLSAATGVSGSKCESSWNTFINLLKALDDPSKLSPAEVASWMEVDRKRKAVVSERKHIPFGPADDALMFEALAATHNKPNFATAARWIQDKHPGFERDAADYRQRFKDLVKTGKFNVSVVQGDQNGKEAQKLDSDVEREPSRKRQKMGSPEPESVSTEDGHSEWRRRFQEQAQRLIDVL